MLSMRSICQAERFLSLSWEPLSFCSPPSVARTRQEIQLSSLLTTALLVPLSADRSATELSITRLASELFAILASELLHLSLHAKESRLFLSTTCDWRCSGSQPNLQLHHHLHLHRVVLVPHPQDHQVGQIVSLTGFSCLHIRLALTPSS